MKIVFSLVLYNNSINELKPLINSFNSLIRFNPKENVIIAIFNNSENEFIKKKFKALLDPALIFIYKKSNKNIGFGKGHNFVFKELYKQRRIDEKDIFVVTNPDIYFEPNEFLKITNFLKLKKNKKIICLGPLLKNQNNQIQYSAKKNPTILSLLIGRLKVLENFKILKKYISNNQNRSSTKNKLIYCEFLSGCFLVIRSKNFFEINGFDERYFLHFEDADITRTLSKKGLCIHYPFSTIYHRWNRGSHISLKQTFLLLNSMIKYFQKWGLSIF